MSKSHRGVGRQVIDHPSPASAPHAITASRSQARVMHRQSGPAAALYRVRLFGIVSGPALPAGCTLTRADAPGTADRGQTSLLARPGAMRGDGIPS
jgi:hypothetical protein